jgi:hypothetical protein
MGFGPGNVKGKLKLWRFSSIRPVLIGKLNLNTGNAFESVLVILVSCSTFFSVVLETCFVRYRTLLPTFRCSILLGVEYPFPPVGIVWRGGRQKTAALFCVLCGALRISASSALKSP